MNHFSTNTATYPQPLTMVYPIMKMNRKTLNLNIPYNKIINEVVRIYKYLIVENISNNIDKLSSHLLRYLHNFSRSLLFIDVPVTHPKFSILLTILK